MKKIFLALLILFSTIAVVAQPSNPQKTFDKLIVKQVKYYKEATFSIDSLTSIIYNRRFDEINNKLASFSLEDFECEIGSTIIANVILDKATHRRAILTFGSIVT